MKSWYRMQPRLQMSLLFVVGLLWTHSGAMYYEVPTKYSCWPRFGSLLMNVLLSSGFSRSSLDPKSISFTPFNWSSLKNMFSGFKSLCMIPIWCNFCTHSHIFKKVYLATLCCIIPKLLQCSHTSSLLLKISVKKYKFKWSLKVARIFTVGMSF